MNDKHTKARGAKPPRAGGENPAGTAAAPRTVPVLARFTREELDAMKSETGATADATAVACFARVNLTRAAKREP